MEIYYCVIVCFDGDVYESTLCLIKLSIVFR